MSFTVTDIDATVLSDSEAFLTSIISDQFPSLDLTKGRVLYELLVRPAAMFYACNQTNIASLKASLSLIAANETPELVDSEIMDAVLANLRISRSAGSKATGRVIIVLSENVSTVIPRLTKFTVNGMDFYPTDAFIGVTNSANVVNSATRLITTRSDGYWQFAIDLQADDVGSEYNIQAGNHLTLDPAISRVIYAYVETGFTGGSDYETNTALMRKAQSALSPQVVCSRNSTDALIKSQYTSVLETSIIGAGDAEMRRDRANVFGTSTGGHVDIYAKTRAVPMVEAVTVTCTLVDVAQKRFYCSIPRDTAAGVYEIKAVVPADANLSPSNIVGLYSPFVGSLPITGLIRGSDVTEIEDAVPYVTTASDVAFSRYQTLNFYFTDTSFNTLDIGDEREFDYKVYLVKMPYIADIQDYLVSRGRRPCGYDVVVKAPVPIICTLGFSITKINANAADIDEAALKSAISSRVSTIPFQTGQLSASAIIDVIATTIGSDYVLELPMTLTGKLIKPDDTTQIIVDANKLTVPDNATAGVTNRTAAFYLDANDIDITITDLDNRPV